MNTSEFTLSLFNFVGIIFLAAWASKSKTGFEKMFYIFCIVCFSLISLSLALRLTAIYVGS
jgi:hypothetical protein